MKKLLLIFSVLLSISSVKAATCDYYASTSGTSSGTGTISSPWDLQTALNQTSLVVSGKTLCVQGGTYHGKYKSTLNGGTVQAINAVIDGYIHTTLSNNMAAGSEPHPVDEPITFAVADASLIKPFTDSGVCQGVLIDGEAFFVTNITGNNITAYRAAGGSIDSGAVAHTSGAVVRLAGEQLWIAGNDTTYKNFELMTSSPFRNWQTDGYEGTRGTGIFNVGNGNKFINCVTHDNLNGIFSGNDAHDTDVYGCLSYNNGMINGTNGNGHGMYLENGSGVQNINSNIVINNFNLGTQLYGVTASYVGGNIQNNVYANNGSPLGGVAGTVQRNINLLVGTESETIEDVNIENNYFFHPILFTNGSQLAVGYGAGVKDASVLNNIFVGGGGTQLGVTNTGHINVTGNKFYGADATESPTPQSPMRYAQAEDGLNGNANWNNNTYYDAGSREVFTNSKNGLTFTQWKDFFDASPAFDTSSTTPSGSLPNTVIVIPNTYEVGRANVVAYSTTGTTSISINLSTTGLINGQDFVIKSAFNYSGSNVYSGTYDSSSPSINVTLSDSAVTSVASPISAAYTPSTTAPNFSAFVVVPTPVISGTVTYGNAIGSPSVRAVSGAALSTTGISDSTDSSGIYVLQGFGSASYTVTPSKTADTRTSISSFDAALVAQYASSVITLTSTQQIVADVSGNGMVTSFDASQIASFAISGTGGGQSGTWKFSPISRTYPEVFKSISGEDYSALLMGDVSGNWGISSLIQRASGPEQPIGIGLPSLMIRSTNGFAIPIEIQNVANKGVISYEFDLRYDPNLIQPQDDPSDLKGTVSHGFTIMTRVIKPGLLRVVVYGTKPISNDGVLLNLKFATIGKTTSVSPLSFERVIFNEGEPSVRATDGQVDIR